MRVFLLPLLALLLPTLALAQSPSRDIAYCNRLADLYERYIGRSQDVPSRPNLGGSLDADVAVSVP